MTNPLDIRLTNTSDSVDLLGYFDITVSDTGDLDLENGFDTNIIMSLFCERRASIDEVLEPILRRGWWGNTLATSPGFEIGSKLWLLEQARLTENTVNLAQKYAEQALEWLVSDGFLDSVVVSSSPSFTSSAPNIELKIDLIRKDSAVEYKYYGVWEATGVTT